MPCGPGIYWASTRVLGSVDSDVGRLKAWNWAAPAGKLTPQEGRTHHDEGGITEAFCDPGGHLLGLLVWAVEKDL